MFLAAGITGSVYLITDFLYGEPTTAPVTAAIGGAFFWFWWGMPLIRRLRDRRRRRPHDPSSGSQSSARE